MNVLNDMLKSTHANIKRNQDIQNNYQQKQLEEKEARKTTTINVESREVKMIKSLGLNIDIFEPADEKESYYNQHEYYYCCNDLWKVKIRNLLYDADLGTILQVLELTDKITGETVDFYCDLWCENTGEYRLEQFKKILHMSLKEYKDLEFSMYYTLPQILRNKGYEVEEKNFVFDLYKCLGELIISKENQKCVLTINHEYGKNVRISKIKKDYYFDDVVSYPAQYNSEEDIDILCNQIDALLEHLSGKFGYLEYDKYYNNNDVEKLFTRYENKLPHVTDTTEGYKYFGYNEDEEPTEEEIKEYKRVSALAEINNYNGAEIYKTYQIDINNHDAYWFGGIGEEYDFEFIYNINLDKENCILNVKHTISEYYGQNYIHDKNLRIENQLNTQVENETIKGSFLELYQTLEDFLNGLVIIIKTQK